MLDFTKGIEQLIEQNKNLRKNIDVNSIAFSNYIKEFASIRFFVGRQTGNSTIIKNLADKFNDISIILVPKFTDREQFKDNQVFCEDCVVRYKLKGLRYDYIFIDNPSQFIDLNLVIRESFTDKNQTLIILGL